MIHTLFSIDDISLDLNNLFSIDKLTFHIFFQVAISFFFQLTAVALHIQAVCTKTSN